MSEKQGQDQSATGSAFGENAANGDPDGDGSLLELSLRFPGQQFEALTGLSYNYFRDYEPGTGRYVESDPIGLDGGITTYSYVNSMPLLTFDRTGLVSFREGYNCLSNYGWDACRAIDKCGSKAVRYSEEFFDGVNTTGNLYDAQRHCYLACCITKVLGAQTAQRVLDDHERLNPPPPNRICELVQDNLNNSKGIEVGSANKSCKECRRARTVDYCPLRPTDWCTP